MATTKQSIPENSVVERASSDEGVRLFSVKSRTLNVTYSVVVTDESPWHTSFTCTCEAGRRHRKCWHQEAVKQFMADLDAKARAYVALMLAEEREETVFWVEFLPLREQIAEGAVQALDASIQEAAWDRYQERRYQGWYD